MTWPTSAVATTNLDQGTDEPRLARVELKQAVDNVNAIATEFGNVVITSPTEGQALVRSGNAWVNANVSTGGGGGTSNYIGIISGDWTTGTWDSVRRLMWMNGAINGYGVTVDTNTHTFTVSTTGSYLVRLSTWAESASAQCTVVIRNVTDSTNATTVATITNYSDDFGTLNFNWTTVTLTTGKTYSVFYNSPLTSAVPINTRGWSLEVAKV